jgi:hypothetical protein
VGGSWQKASIYIYIYIDGFFTVFSSWYFLWHVYI